MTNFNASDNNQPSWPYLRCTGNVGMCVSLHIHSNSSITSKFQCTYIHLHAHADLKSKSIEQYHITGGQYIAIPEKVSHTWLDQTSAIFEVVFLKWHDQIQTKTYEFSTLPDQVTSNKQKPNVYAVRVETDFRSTINLTFFRFQMSGRTCSYMYSHVVFRAQSKPRRNAERFQKRCL